MKIFKISIIFNQYTRNYQSFKFQIDWGIVITIYDSKEHKHNLFV